MQTKRPRLLGSKHRLLSLKTTKLPSKRKFLDYKDALRKLNSKSERMRLTSEKKLKLGTIYKLLS